MHQVDIFTDGACLGNPGPGGWSAILRWGAKEKELCGGFARTTNNRMELMAAIHALETLRAGCRATVYSDSRYLCDAVTKGWLYGWRKKNWLKSDKKAVPNRDLWERLLVQLARHETSFEWVEGHSGHPENERADQLARQAAQNERLPKDLGYGAP